MTPCAPRLAPAPCPPRPCLLTCACRFPGARRPLPALPAPARRAPACRRLLRQCQPGCSAWVWDPAARRTGSEQRRARQEGRWQKGGDTGRYRPLTSGTRPAAQCGCPWGPGDRGASAQDADTTLPSKDRSLRRVLSPLFALHLSLPPTWPGLRPHALLPQPDPHEAPESPESGDINARLCALGKATRRMA